MPPGEGFSFSNFTKFKRWTEFHFKIQKVIFFQLEGFIFSIHVAIFNIQTAFLHIEIGLFNQKNNFFCVVEPYLKKTSIAPLHQNCHSPKAVAFLTIHRISTSIKANYNNLLRNTVDFD